VSGRGRLGCTKSAGAASQSFEEEDEKLAKILCENVATAIAKEREAEFTKRDVEEATATLKRLETQLRDAEEAKSGVSDIKGRQDRLLQLAMHISSTGEVDKLFNEVIEHARDLLDAERATLFLIDREEEILWSRVAQGTQSIRIPLSQGIAGEVARTG